MKKTIKFGFTLAEVLITLGIIGVIAAITIPALISTYRKKQLEAQIKTTYTTIQQIIKFAEAEGASYNMVKINDDKSLKEFFDNYIARHTKFEQIFINKIPNTLYRVHYASGNQYGDIGERNITFTTAKGATIYMRTVDPKSSLNRYGVKTDDNSLIIWFDANGKDKPNVMGTDFHVTVWSDKGLFPGGYSLSAEDADISCYNQQGHACLSKIIKDGWKIPKKVWKRRVYYEK